MISARPTMPKGFPSRRWRYIAAAALTVLPVTGHALSLERALLLAVQHDPAVAQSLAQYEVDREADAADRASLRPSLNASAQANYANTRSEGVFGELEEDYGSWGTRIEARQPIFRMDWAARGARADALRDRADNALRERRNQLIVRVAERYFAVLDARDAVATLHEEARAVGETLEDTRKRFEVELVARTDLVEAQARDDIARARLLSARRALDNARDALDEITGAGDVELPELDEAVMMPDAEPGNSDAWVAAALNSNPELLQAIEDREIARADRRSRDAARMPELDIVASVGIDDTSRFQFGQRNEDQRIGLELNVPIYAGGQLTAQARAAAAQVRVAEASLERLRGNVAREVRARFRAVDSAAGEADAFRRALESARAARGAAANGYEAGTRTVTDLLDAESRVSAARRDFNRTRYELLLNLLRLKEMVGTLDREDFRHIDRLFQADASTDSAAPTAATDNPKDPS